MKAIKKDNNDGKVSAFAVNTAMHQTDEGNRGCWKCGGTDHMKKDCPKADAIRTHKCSKCGKLGHIEKFCRGEGTDGRSQTTMKKPVKAVHKSDYSKKGPSNKSARTQKVLKEALARLMTLDDDEDEDMPLEDAYGDNDDGNGDDDDGDDVFFTGCTTCDLGDSQESNQHLMVQAMMTHTRRLIIDSGCRGAHVVSSDGLVQKTVDTSTWKKMPVVRGISGHHRSKPRMWGLCLA